VNQDFVEILSVSEVVDVVDIVDIVEVFDGFDRLKGGGGDKGCWCCASHGSAPRSQCTPRFHTIPKEYP
jgi:hypothetical protein